jgi:hypothetical protein
MTAALPVRSLLRFNLAMTVAISGTISLYLFIENQPYFLLYTGMTAVAIASISYSNVLILIFLNKKIGIGSKPFVRYRLILSYLVSFGIYAALSPVFAHYSGRSLSYLHKQFWIILLISSALVNTLVLILHRLILLMYWKSQTDLELSQLRTAHAEAANLLLVQHN